MDVAARTAATSHAEKMKVGAVAVRERRILLCGFNGTPAGTSNVCEETQFPSETDLAWMTPEELSQSFPYINSRGERYALVTRYDVLHAEENLILYAAKKGIALYECDLYCTHLPCLHCARMIFGAGIRRVVYREAYRDREGERFLRGVGLALEHYEG